MRFWNGTSLQEIIWVVPEFPDSWQCVSAFHHICTEGMAVPFQVILFCSNELLTMKLKHSTRERLCGSVGRAPVFQLGGMGSNPNQGNKIFLAITDFNGENCKNIEFSHVNRCPHCTVTSLFRSFSMLIPVWVKSVLIFNSCVA